MDEDAINLFEQDRQRFLAIYLEILADPNISEDAKREIVQSTENAVRGIGALRPTDE